MRHALRVACIFLFAALCCATAALAQTETATVSGLITDSSGAVVLGAEVHLQNVDRGTSATATTNNAGIYVFASIQPGQYQISVRKAGFKQVDLLGVIVNVQDHIEQNFRLEVGSLAESVTVRGGAPLINTESATVSTVVDREFVGNLPLNGRSFQTLIALTPGVVLTPTNYGNQGQFSSNGQRADANYFTVDGVSANIAISGGGGLAQSAGGALPGFSALGGTNSLVSVDAMQEFRVQTSSFAPEFGRTPGGQISIATRSGTNQFHGSVFEYFRNDVLDANDWFANKSNLAKPEERQNDFGGVFGGPIIKNKTFFFFSYEGLRLRQPRTQETLVPDAASRQTAPAEIQPFLNAFPVPNGPEFADGLAQFNASYSNPSNLNAYSTRIDHMISPKLILFGRYNYSPSQVAQRGSTGALSDTAVTSVSVHTLTLGLTGILAPHITNEVRANYSNERTGTIDNLDSFGGAVPPPDALLFPPGFSSRNSAFIFNVIEGAGLHLYTKGKTAINEQRQFNLLDNLAFNVAGHQLKFGVDYRWLSPISGPTAYDSGFDFLGITGPQGALSGTAADAVVAATQGATLLSQNFSLYGQDTWKATPRLTLTYGLRWDVNPPLKGKNSASQPFTVQGLNDSATMTLAPQGTPLYQTTYGNVAPRVGMAYQSSQKKGWESVLRGGFGVFYDLGSGLLGQATTAFPYAAVNVLFCPPFPLTPAEATPPPFSLNPPVSAIYVADRNLKLPRTYQWNIAVEQSVGSNHILSLTYLGAVGRDLLRQDTLFNPNATFQDGTVFVTRNSATSDYNALQLKFQRRLSRGLQALASYTFSHSIDIASNDSESFNTPSSLSNVNIDRGNSDFDVRHSFAGAVTWDVPVLKSRTIARAVLGSWSIDTFILARSSPPVNVLGPFFFVGSFLFRARADLVPGMPFYLYGPQYPGGKALNPAAFVAPANAQQGDFGRNVLRGFGAWQADLALHRQFPLSERLALQFRAEFFNIFNHPNFGSPDNGIGDPFFGQSTQMLGPSLGSGGLQGGFNPLYQIGGPRSMQLALKLRF